MSSTEMETTFENKLSWRIKAAILLVKFARRIACVFSRITGPIVPLANAFGLGLLDKEQINQLVRYSYTSQPDYYNPDNYDYQWEEEIIEPLKKETNRRNLLVAFCGKGREAEIFARHDYNVTGIDREIFMINDAIEIAKEKGFESHFECVDFNKYTSSTPYDIVYTSTWMYTTYPDAKDRMIFLSKCRDLCTKNGIIVISYRIRNNDTLDFLIHFITKTIALLSFGNHKATKGDRIENGLFWHYFTEVEIENELKKAGMRTCFHRPSDNGRLEWRFLRSIAN